MTDKHSESQERVIGDLHFFDKNIIQMGPRNFKTVGEMNEVLLEQWNDTVAPNDIVFVLGDFFDCTNCTKEQMFDILNRLNGEKILIAGNHDVQYLDWYKEYGMDVIAYSIVKDEFWILSHEPQYVSLAAPYANIFAHVHLNPIYRDVSPRSFCVSAERIGYKPMLLDDIKTAILHCKE